MIIEDNLKLSKYITSTGVSEENSAVALSVAQAVRKDVEQVRMDKNVYPQMHWDFYHSHQEKYFVQRANEDKPQYDDRVKNGKVVNYIRFVVDLDTRFLYGRPNKIGRFYGNSSVTEGRMGNINKLIHIDNLQMEAKRKASLYGEQGFRLIPVDKRTGSQVEIINEINENVYPHPVPLDPRSSFFLLNPYGKVIAVVLIWDYKDYADQEKTYKVTELYTDDSRWKWYDDSLQVAEKSKYKLREEFVLQKNNPERIDNIQDMIPLQTSLNEGLTDNIYFFARHGRPQLVSSVDLRNVVGKGDMVWEIDVGDEEHQKVLDKLGFLVWDGKMEAAQVHLEKLESKMFKVSSTAAISTGDLVGIGNLRSGAALETAHSPSIQKSQEQQIIWAENEENLARAIIAFDSRIHKTTVDKRFPDFDFIMKFPKDSGVPGSEIMNREIKQININSHLTTIEDSIREDNPKFTDSQVEEYRKQLIKDSDELTDAKRAFVTEQKDPNANSNSSGSKKSAEQKKPKK